MRVRSKLERLERQLLPPPPPSPDERRRERRWRKVSRRFLVLVEQADAEMTEDERAAIEAILDKCGDGGCQPLDSWLRDLMDGRSRLPELTARVMKALVLGWFHPDVDTISYVCSQCGLQYPRLKAPPPQTWKVLPGKVPNVGPPPWYDLPELFNACPQCAASTRDVTYSHQTDDMDLPWKKLDGWMGQKGVDRCEG
jgi:hypothetical protein